jgi:hypothetical protein
MQNAELRRADVPHLHFELKTFYFAHGLLAMDIGIGGPRATRYLLIL